MKISLCGTFLYIGYKVTFCLHLREANQPPSK